MDKWLTKSTSLINEENVDEPEPPFVTDSANIIDSSGQKPEDSHSTTIDKKKKSTVIRKFNQKWIHMSEYKN